MASFTDIVSLGYRCRTTRRLRDHFGFETAFPFDWWVTPLKGAIRIVQDWDLDALYDPDSLREVWIGDRLAYIKHEHYGVKLQHDFPFEPDGKWVDRNWRAGLDNARARSRHLMERFDALNCADRRVLFVRELDGKDERAIHRAVGLKTVIQQRIPLAETAFLLISRSGIGAEGWIALQIDDPLEDPWEGNAAIWDAALSTLGFSLGRSDAPQETSQRPRSALGPLEAGAS